MELLVVGILLVLVGTWLESKVRKPSSYERKFTGRTDQPTDQSTDQAVAMEVNGVDFEVESDIECQPDILVKDGILNADGSLKDRKAGIVWLMKVAKKKKRTEEEEEAMEVLGPLLEKRKG